MFNLLWSQTLLENCGFNLTRYNTVRYQVVRYKNPSLGITKIVTAKELQLKISDLVKIVCYKFDVIAKNKGGESLADERLIETNSLEVFQTETVNSARETPFWKGRECLSENLN